MSDQNSNPPAETAVASDPTFTTPSGLVIDQDAIYWSPTELGFYPGAFYPDYVAADTWPSDARIISHSLHAQYSGNTPAGGVRGADAQGNPCWKPAPAPRGDDAKRAFSYNIDKALDAFAATWGYTKGIDNATTWANSSDPQYAAEGKALATWRDQVWAWAATQPTDQTYIDGMPAAPARPVTGAPA